MRLLLQDPAIDTCDHSSLRLVTYVVPAQASDRMETPLEAQLGEAIRLEGYTLGDQAASPGEALGVTLFWSAGEPLETRYKVFVHLYGPDGTLIAWTTHSNTIILWDTGTGEARYVLVSDSSGLCEIAWSPDGKTLAAGAGNGMIVLWEAP